MKRFLVLLKFIKKAFSFMYLIANSLQNNVLYKEHDYYNVLEWRSQDFPGRGFMNPKFGKF